MLGELAGRENPGRGNPEPSCLLFLKNDLKEFGAAHGSTAGELCASKSQISLDGGGVGEGGRITVWHVGGCREPRGL